MENHISQQQSPNPISSSATKAEIFSSTNIKSCRICLINGDQKEKEKFVSPCRCYGSLQYVHEQCIKHWIQSKLRTQIQGKKDICEICKFPIKFKVENKFVLRQCKDIKKQMEEEKVLAAIKLILIFLIFSFTIILIVLAQIGQLEVENEQKMGYYIYRILLFIFPFTIVMLMIVFIFCYMIERKSYISQIIEPAPSKKQRNESIIPICQ